MVFDARISNSASEGIGGTGGISSEPLLHNPSPLVFPRSEERNGWSPMGRVAESVRVSVETPLRYFRESRVSIERTKVLLIRARARVVPDTAEEAGDDT